MKLKFKRVPAIDKCFAILELLAGSKKPLGVSEISKALGLNKSTVFNIVYTLDDRKILEKKSDGKFQFGTRLYILGRAAGGASELIATVHPYLEKINNNTQLSAFLGLRMGLKTVIIDKADSASNLKIHSEVGMSIPLFAGAAGKALLAQLDDDELDDVLANNELEKFTPNTCVDKREYKRQVINARTEGIAIDREEYIEGVRAFAVPVPSNWADTQIALWAVGFKQQITTADIPEQSEYFKAVSREIELKLSPGLIN
jgi:IclR family transcriptional regulator, KDG regulon repressor